MRDVYEESITNRSLHGLNLTRTIVTQSTSSDVRSIVRDLPIVELAYVRPRAALPLELTAFEHQHELDETFSIGERDAASGFTPYVRDTFRL